MVLLEDKKCASMPFERHHFFSVGRRYLQERSSSCYRVRSGHHVRIIKLVGGAVPDPYPVPVVFDKVPPRKVAVIRSPEYSRPPPCLKYRTSGRRVSVDHERVIDEVGEPRFGSRGRKPRPDRIPTASSVRVYRRSNLRQSGVNT